ncbi:GLPGLI family protein [Flavobacterium ardleyense]|uniref:GLPGLI family protein n=1 Tax=Flavobacterium ardleyense TaxID=2038737 RepID=A0ABW5Z9P9_9FLAO
MKRYHMKHIILFFLLVQSFLVFSQYKSGRIEYNLVIGHDEKLANDEKFKFVLESAIEGAKLISFDLVFNNESSFFKKKESLENENTGYAEAMSGAKDCYYNIKNGIEKIKQIDNYTGHFVIKYNDETKWELSEETKIIDNYICYKAISTQIVINSKSTFTHPVIAWYCPSIPFSYGPKGYTGLPGLILELQVRHIKWGATKISLSTENKIIDEPTKGKVVTEEEYKNIVIKGSPTF